MVKITVVAIIFTKSTVLPCQKYINCKILYLVLTKIYRFTESC